MADLVIHDSDAERLCELARIENRSIEEIVTQMIDAYASRRHTESDAASSHTHTEYILKLYAYARAFWQRVNDTARLSLTDDQLDEQFWCIDPEGIPRLKSDQEKVDVPPDNLSGLVEAVLRDNATGEVEEPINYREILNDEFPTYLIHRQTQGNKAQSDTNR